MATTRTRGLFGYYTGLGRPGQAARSAAGVGKWTPEILARQLFQVTKQTRLSTRESWPVENQTAPWVSPLASGNTTFKLLSSEFMHYYKVAWSMDFIWGDFIAAWCGQPNTTSLLEFGKADKAMMDDKRYQTYHYWSRKHFEGHMLLLKLKGAKQSDTWLWNFHDFKLWM